MTLLPIPGSVRAAAAASLAALLLATAACSRPVEIGGRSCPCDEVEYTCCPTGYRCVPVSDRGDECLAFRPDGGSIGHQDGGSYPDQTGPDGADIPYDAPRSHPDLGPDVTMTLDGLTGPELGDGELIFDPPMAEGLLGWDVCVAVTLKLPDGQMIPMTEENLAGFSAMDSKTFRPGGACPAGEGRLGLESWVPGEGSLQIFVNYQDVRYQGTLPTRVLPWVTEVTGGDLVAPVGQVTPLQLTFSFHDDRFQPVEWENPHAFFSETVTLEIDDPTIARQSENGIDGLNPGQTTFTMGYYQSELPPSGPYNLTVE